MFLVKKQISGAEHPSRFESKSIAPSKQRQPKFRTSHQLASRHLKSQTARPINAIGTYFIQLLIPCSKGAPIAGINHTSKACKEKPFYQHGKFNALHKLSRQAGRKRGCKAGQKGGAPRRAPLKHYSVCFM